MPLILANQLCNTARTVAIDCLCARILTGQFMLELGWGDRATGSLWMSECMDGGGISWRRHIAEGFKLEIETREEHEWHENMSAHPAIASFQTTSFCFGTLQALLMLYGDEPGPVLPTFKKRTASPRVWLFRGEASQAEAQKCKQDSSQSQSVIEKSLFMPSLTPVSGRVLSCGCFCCVV